MDVRWGVLKPREGGVEPGDVGLGGTARLRLPFLNLHLRLFRRCSRCGGKRCLRRADLLVRAVSNQDDGRPTVAFMLVGWLCPACRVACHREDD